MARLSELVNNEVEVEDDKQHSQKRRRGTGPEHDSSLASEESDKADSKSPSEKEIDKVLIYMQKYTASL